MNCLQTRAGSRSHTRGRALDHLDGNTGRMAPPPLSSRVVLCVSELELLGAPHSGVRAATIDGAERSQCA